MYRFALRPWWIASHLAVLALVVAMLNLAAWQFRRLDEKKDRNALIEANASRPAVSLEEMLAELERSPIERLQFRRVQVTGRYVPESEVAVRNRSLDGAPGRWIATPLTGEGEGSLPVLVVRGFVPLAVDDTEPPIDGVEPPQEVVTAVGWVQPTQTKGRFGATDPAEGTLGELSRVDVERVEAQYRELAPFWLQLESQEPPSDAELLSPVPLPELDEGPHLGYAVQWLIFTTIAIVGYPLVLRKVARQRPADDATGEGGPPGGGPGDGPPSDGDPTADITSVAGSAPSP